MSPENSLPTLPDGLRLVRVLSRTDRGTVLLVERDGGRYVVRFARLAAAVAEQVQALATVAHDGLVAPTECGQTAEGEFFLLRPFVDGQELDVAVRGADTGTVVRWVASLCASLDVLHRHGRVHRDVKSSNVILGGDRACLIDLEFLAPIDADRTAVGSPLHLAPEVASGGDVRPAADLFALGCALAYAYCGRPGRDFHRHFPVADFWEASGLDADRIPDALRDLVRALVRRHPADRPPSAAAAAALLGGPATPPSPRLPFLAGRRTVLAQVARELDAGGLLVLGVEDEIELSRVADALRLECALVGLDATITVADDGEHARRVARAAAIEPDGPTCLVVTAEQQQRILAVLEPELRPEELARVRRTTFPVVDERTVIEHLGDLCGVGPAAERLGRSLFIQTNGRHADLARLLAGAVADGVLRVDDGRFTPLREDWPRAGLDGDGVGLGLERLSAHARYLLAAIGLLEGRATSATAVATAGLDPRAGAEALAELVGAAMVVPGVGADGALLLDDRRSMAPAVARLDARRLGAFHRRAANELEARGAPPWDVARHALAVARTDAELAQVLDIASAARVAGRPVRARELATGILAHDARTRAQGDAATTLLARVELAAGNAARAMALLHDAWGQTFEAAPPEGLVVAAEVAEVEGDRTLARGLFERVLDAEVEPDLALRARVGVGYAIWLDGHAARALAKIDGLPTAADAAGPACMALNLRGGALAELGRFEEADRALDAAGARAEESGDPTMVGRAALNRAFVLRRTGRGAEAARALERARLVFESADDAKLASLAANNAGVLLRDLGELNRAREAFARSLLVRRRAGDAHGVAVTTANLGALELDAGRAGAALEWLRRAEQLTEAGGYRAELCTVRAALVGALALVGRTVEGRAVSGRGEGLGQDLGALRSQAVLELAEAHDERAARTLERALAAHGPGARAAERFRTARFLLCLRPDSELASSELAAARVELGGPARDAEFEWLTASAERRGDPEWLERLLARFETDGRSDLVFAVATRLAEALHLAGRAEERRVATARALAATDAIAGGAAEDGAARTGVVARTARLAGLASKQSLARRSSWLVEWTRRLASGDDLERLLLDTVDRALDVTGAERGMLVLCAGDEFEVQVVRNMDHETLAAELARFSRHVVAEAVRTGVAVRTTDATRDGRFAGVDSIASLELRSILCVPLPEIEGRTGALYLAGERAAASFDRFDEQAAVALADQTAIAVTHLLRQDRARERAASLEGRLDAREREVRSVRERLEESERVAPVAGLVGESAPMVRLVEEVRALGASDLPVLVSGPRGSELAAVARALHDHSPRAGRSFLTLNVGAVTPADLDAELFGAQPQGARARPGVLARAGRGTLYLDRVDELPAAVQLRLLGALETGTYKPVGAGRERRVDARVVASARTDLLGAVREGRFDRELFDVLAGARVGVPALAARTADIPLLARAQLASLNRAHGTDKRVTDAVLARLAERAWPGELRELFGEIARLYFLFDRIDDPDAVRQPSVSTGERDSMPASFRLDDLERAAIARALEATGGNKDAAAKALGISRAGLYKKLARLGSVGQD